MIEVEKTTATLVLHPFPQEEGMRTQLPTHIQALKLPSRHQTQEEIRMQLAQATEETVEHTMMAWPPEALVSRTCLLHHPCR